MPRTFSVKLFNEEQNGDKENRKKECGLSYICCLHGGVFAPIENLSYWHGYTKQVSYVHMSGKG